jgi:hypothetical protein
MVRRLLHTASDAAEIETTVRRIRPQATHQPLPGAKISSLELASSKVGFDLEPGAQSMGVEEAEECPNGYPFMCHRPRSPAIGRRAERFS